MRKMIFVMLLFITSSYLNAQAQKTDEQRKVNETNKII